MSENLSPMSRLTHMLPYLVLSVPFLSLPTISLSPNQIHIEASPLSLKCGSLGVRQGRRDCFSPRMAFSQVSTSLLFNRRCPLFVKNPPDFQNNG